MQYIKVDYLIFQYSASESERKCSGHLSRPSLNEEFFKNIDVINLFLSRSDYIIFQSSASESERKCSGQLSRPSLNDPAHTWLSSEARVTSGLLPEHAVNFNVLEQRRVECRYIHCYVSQCIYHTDPWLFEGTLWRFYRIIHSFRSSLATDQSPGHNRMFDSPIPDS